MSLREERVRRGWSQEELADASGVSVRTVQRVEGGRPAGRATTAALAAALGVEPEVLADAAPGEAAGAPAPEVTFAEALRLGARGWSSFEGRASRSEYWFLVLAAVVVVGAPAALDDRLGAFVGVLCLVPLLAAGTRRLRDAGQSPWWQLFLLVPFGFVVTATLMVLPGRDEPAPVAPRS
ncbi:DUF805 domain-containing protein [Phycicoccus sonneratiae]|uniref:DUF805 domain-containing protein n=1 Tax=Phycicoccus sonneratiae TaxID=2807628 RepID=A0ABS2CMJ8_9MICO|nr:DUF805 domain-containing protein [Phycicoccus sonneraticus]MBM6400406.1 DUF805 domain-containing protein [Phycicoccus sonneraticus]